MPRATHDLMARMERGSAIKEIENAAVLYKFLSSLLIKLNTR